MPRIIASLLIFAAFAVAPLASSAAIITVPTDLIPGQSYRLAFVTSTTRDATSTNIADYNSFVAAVAAGQTALAALGTTWTAIGSTATVDARDNTGTNPSSTGVPIYRLDDTRIADTNPDLWDGVLSSSLNINEAGTTEFVAVWTGTDSSGVALSPLGTSNPEIGSALVTSANWIQHVTNPNDINSRIYAISGELTVIPEPSSMMLVCIGATAVAAWQLRRRRHRKACRNLKRVR